MKFYTRTRRKPEVIIVSLIDIFAILLIFVIVTTTFKTAQPAVTIKLPGVEDRRRRRRASSPVVLAISEKEESTSIEKVVRSKNSAPSIERDARGQRSVRASR